MQNNGPLALFLALGMLPYLLARLRLASGAHLLLDLVTAENS